MSGVAIAGAGVAYDGVMALEGVSIEIPSGTWVALIGPNGAGKTSLLRAIAGLVGHHGEISVSGERVAGMNRRRVSRLAAFVPQRPVTPESMTVTDFVLLGRTPFIPYLGTETRRDLEVVEEVLDRLELSGLAGRTLGTLSGGEVQRAVLGRALAQQAPLLLLDEPTAALDVGHQQQVLELIDELRVEQGLTVISAMHDLTLAGQFAERLVLLSAGRAVAGGTARAVLTERIIHRYYDASVRVISDGNGGVLVVPTRARRAPSAEGTTA